MDAKDSPKLAQPGDELIVIHEFVARSPDELSLAKGDRLRLIERDDDFGDGWYLGQHIRNGTTGLFPEVYTKMVPKTRPTASQVPSSSSGTTSQATGFVATGGDDGTRKPASSPYNMSPTIAMNGQGAASAFSIGQSPSIPSPGYPPATYASSPGHPPSNYASAPPSSYRPPASNSSSIRGPTKGSTVMNETLSVIDEHITDMNKPGTGHPGMERRQSSDSGSQYSSRTDQKPSYINGEETDEEENGHLTREEISRWSPERVAAYLESVGVEKRHCEVFHEQEFSGDVLLGMDQQSVFLKELELGPIGRRLKTWHKIKALQDLVNKNATPKRKASDVAVTPGIPQSPSSLASLQTQAQAGRKESPFQNFAQGSPKTSRRPSAASVRELHHSRNTSSIDQTGGHTLRAATYSEPSTHGKQPSFDRSWTMNATTAPPMSAIPQRPASTTHVQSASTDRSQFGTISSGASPVMVYSPHEDIDRGYVSGGEADSRRLKNVLRKRDTSEHQRHSSYEKRSSGMFWKRASGGDKTSELPAAAAAAASTDVLVPPKKENNVRVVSEPIIKSTSPAVTKLEYDDDARRNQRVSAPRLEGSDIVVPRETSRTRMKPASIDTGFRRGLRTISDAVTGREKSIVDPNADKSSIGETPQSPARTVSSNTPSASSKGAEAEEKPEASPIPGMGLVSTAIMRKSNKRATSAFQRGLEKKRPQEQMLGCEYSGWMKKKSSNFMTTWKPRLFVLRGRRLSYYYSEDDTEEKGVIDISNHRVLPASSDFLTGLHASITGVNAVATPAINPPPIMSVASESTLMSQGEVDSPTSATTVSSMGPPGDNTPTFDPKRSDSIKKTPTEKSETFIFKLLPPRSGLSKAVNFTRPAVHYFAVPTVQEGRLWMAALMKATIDRDDSLKVITTYQQKTISLEKARARRERPPEFHDAEHKAQAAMAKSVEPSAAPSDASFDGSSTLASTQAPESQYSAAASTSAPSQSDTTSALATSTTATADEARDKGLGIEGLETNSSSI